MSLSTITSEDAPSKHKIFKQREMTSLQTGDIDGAKPLLRGYQCINKPEFSNFTSDIDKACPRQLHPSLTKPNFNLDINDIEGSKPHLAKFTTNRITNPLNPNYKLPSFEIRPVTPPKFIRDSMPSDDIEGSRPEKYHKWQTRDQITVKDIEGAKAKPERQLTKPDLMDPKDINGVPFMSRRFTNPLEPEYVGRDFDGNLATHGKIEGSKSKPIIRTGIPPHKRNIDCTDIEGSRPNTVGMGQFANKERNYVKKIVDASDIEGTNANSHKKGIVTKRVTNPLQPKYAWTTEDPNEKVPEKKNPKEIDKVPEEQVKNNSRFWGVTPTITRNNSLQPSRPSTSKPVSTKNLNNQDFQRNIYKFYNQALPPAEMQEQLNKNAERFFANPTAKLTDKFLSVTNPNTIHRSRKEVPIVDATQFNQNLKNFCGVSSSGNSRPCSSNSNYRFSLPRSEIGKPA